MIWWVVLGYTGWQCVGGWHGGGVVAMFFFSLSWPMLIVKKKNKKVYLNKLEKNRV